MKTEYEVIVLNIDVNEIETRLKEVGAVKTGEFFQRRYVYDFNPVVPNKWIRLRTNGEESALTIKEIISEEQIGGAKEKEIKVSDFEKTNEILEELGYFNRSYQENKRILYKYNKTEISIDMWPMLDPYIEIEGSSEKEVEEMIKLLEVDKNKITNKHVTTLYKEKGIDVNVTPELKF